MIGHDNQTEGSNMYSLIIEGMNHRMNTTCKGAAAMACVMGAVVARNTTVARVAAVPENDAWRYDADPATGFKGNYSMMCSAFVAHSYKVGLAGWSGWPPRSG